MTKLSDDDTVSWKKKKVVMTVFVVLLTYATTLF